MAKDKIELSTGRQVIFPDLVSWRKDGVEVSTGRYRYVVAPNDIVDVDGGKYFTYQEALEISNVLAEWGWKLGSAAQWMQIAATVALDNNEGYPSGETLIITLGLDYVGYGVALGNNTDFYSQGVNEEGYYWTSTPRPDEIIVPPPGETLWISKNFMSGIREIDQHERGATVRLIHIC